MMRLAQHVADDVEQGAGPDGGSLPLQESLQRKERGQRKESGQAPSQIQSARIWLGDRALSRPRRCGTRSEQEPAQDAVSLVARQAVNQQQYLLIEPVRFEFHR